MIKCHVPTTWLLFYFFFVLCTQSALITLTFAKSCLELVFVIISSTTKMSTGLWIRLLRQRKIISSAVDEAHRWAGEGWRLETGYLWKQGSVYAPTPTPAPSQSVKIAEDDREILISAVK